MQLFMNCEDAEPESVSALFAQASLQYSSGEYSPFLTPSRIITAHFDGQPDADPGFGGSPTGVGDGVCELN